MNIINVEIYSMIILIILISDYVISFNKKFNAASKLWLTLSISTLSISINNIIFTFSTIYIVRLVSLIIYLLSILVSSLFVYLYVKYLYIETKMDFKKERRRTITSILLCIILTILYVFFISSKYQLHSFDRRILNQLLILAIIPNVHTCYRYIYSCYKRKMVVNYKIVGTLLLTVIGLIFDIINESLYFVSSTFTLTALIIYVNKHEVLLNTDTLTGLSNKRGLESFINNIGSNLMYAVFNIDVDKFKNINDQYGHLKGDYVLKNVARILRNSTRVSDLVVRNGGDEFIIVAKIKKRSELNNILERVNYNLNNYNKVEDIKVGLSIGSGVYKTTKSSNMEEFNAFLKQTDEKMYEEKEKHHKNIPSK